MKNIYILPTDKPSRLIKQGVDLKKLWLYTRPIDFKENELIPQNIYITSNEEIKIADWVIEFQKNDSIGQVHFINGEYVIARDIQKKIILTTDFTLSPDVHKIPDEFLEWFVKNPSCEEVEIERGYRGYNLVNYKIIIPKEESKQETTLDKAAEKYAKMMWGVYYDDIHPDIAITQTQGEITVKDFIAGAKWMKEQILNQNK